MLTSTSIESLATALAAAHAEFPPIPKTHEASVYSQRTGSTYTYMYADLADMIGACRPILAAHGLAVVQDFATNPDGCMIVETRLLHTSGQWLATYTAPVSLAGLDIQGVGTKKTYCRRYNYAATIGIAAEDTDGDSASQDRPGARVAAPAGGAAPIEQPAAPVATWKDAKFAFLAAASKLTGQPIDTWAAAMAWYGEYLPEPSTIDQWRLYYVAMMRTHTERQQQALATAGGPAPANEGQARLDIAPAGTGQHSSPAAVGVLN